MQIVDTAGNIVNSYDYDVWGNSLKKEETIENHFTYFGQTYDETTGLYYLRARYYDPSTGRFTQQDPAEDGHNWYVYGNQNPNTYIDQSGESIILSASTVALLYEAAPYIAAGLALAGTVTINYFKSHSKNARKSNWDKHTKKRAGAPSKAEKKPGWQDRSNKKKP